MLRMGMLRGCGRALLTFRLCSGRFNNGLGYRAGPELLGVAAHSPRRTFHKSAALCKRAKSSVDEEPIEEAPPQVNIDLLKSKMAASLQHLQRDFAKIRGGRAEASMFDHITVEAYGSRTNISQVAQVTVKSPTMAVINVFDSQLSAAVVAALRSSEMNLNPSVEGSIVTVPIPKASKETRDALVKLAHKEAEKIKQSLRRIRKGGMDDIKKLKGFASDDEMHKLSKQLDALTEEYVENVNAEYERKTQAIAKS